MAKDRDDDRDDRDDDRPRRRRDDDDDRPAVQLGPLDKMFRDTNMVVLILFGVCCNGIALILGIIALATAKDSKAKSNAMTVTIVAAVFTLINVGANIFRFMNAAR